MHFFSEQYARPASGRRDATDGAPGGDFGGSLRIDASSLTPQPEAMPFGITGFKNLDTLRIAGFTHVSELSSPTESCDDLTIENCGSQAPFTLSLPNLVEVRGTLLCRNCGKAGEANSASFPRLKTSAGSSRST